MAEKLKIISLGGLNEIGKNVTVYEYGGDMIVVDVGMGFPDDDMYGIDVVIPDFSYLIKNRDRIRGIFLTHGHEDHIGSLPYLLRDVQAPIYATRMTAGLVKLKLEEHRLLDKTKLITCEAGETVKAGKFTVEFIHVNHSIADAVSFAIKTPVGVCVHTGDFKIDPTPVSGGMIDLARFGQLGKEGVLALLSDSTNVERPGFTKSEKSVGESFEGLFRGCEERIIVTTFASNVDRMQQIISVAAKYGRKVAVTGRSMENAIKVSTELGYMQIPAGVLVDVNHLKSLPKNKICIITTGSQGETMSALSRMAFSTHKQVDIQAGDRVIISASAIPGNENSVGAVVNELYRKGADVVNERERALHVSGHACQDELKIIHALIKPKFFIPVHGEQRHLKTHAKLAREMGMEPNNIIISDIGKVIELTPTSAKLNGSVPAGRVFVDGYGVGDVGAVVLRDRKHLAEDGMIVVVASMSGEDGSLISGPDIITRGFVYVKESEGLMEELRLVAVAAIQECRDQRVKDWSAIKSQIKNDLSNFLYKKTKRNPMILPVIMEV
ncbi:MULTISPECIES: ribonuclease J [Oscillospiraceae]|uniref:Ribonuclease J n=1 Tax=Lawsonibacter faecis TaxID=2763052 RepID=A0A8J6JLA2_9FIRM|nr:MULTISPECIES: ribonuclease J [Oscillospiraceae]MTQ96941.1 RNase J family beta-CASP ribonuclease [Pseudoflavonifractor sp. BIOML-A16]MTR06625.1 RNase J family beta-CASP ribonuclease [Pseudoflavonifractor sp. BIOML-A15]MTR32821.1 RNase J family beta-CASP ribonuclease [Pseudoflavonifractor sp. BIOML-A14]MTR72929.1 RNase J family beta-CASP ribonuclease [Pseudoflavonifractor sp. BIOML-A18]MTS64557.1 RNase J family beta-CASP ribonuclease [Pseudoflavonifractor sp. BIOML-A5]MTS71021.1 RNase J fami